MWPCARPRPTWPAPWQTGLIWGARVAVDEVGCRLPGRHDAVGDKAGGPFHVGGAGEGHAGIRPDAVKIGMVSSPAIVRAIADGLRRHGAANISNDGLQIGLNARASAGIGAGDGENCLHRGLPFDGLGAHR